MAPAIKIGERAHDVRTARLGGRCESSTRSFPTASLAASALIAAVRPDGAFEAWDAPPTVHGYKGGDLYGVAERLDELVDLGINALYLNPIFSSASNHRYHAYDYLAVDPLLGGDAALRELLDAGARARDPRGPGWRLQPLGPWLLAVPSPPGGGRESPYRDWFLLDQEVRGGKRTR